MAKKREYSYQSVETLMKKNYVALNEQMTIGEALDYIRSNTSDEQIIYFYVTDEQGILKGVVSTRKLLIEQLEMKISDVIDKRIKFIPVEASLIDVWEVFIFHKFLALPVVDKERHLLGTIDITQFSDNISDIMERDQADELFETIGFKLSQIRDASSIKVFRYRFPWLMATIISGIFSALMVSRFELVLAQSIILAFFLTLVLGLGESVSMQSMTVTIQALRNLRPTLSWYAGAIFKELKTAFLLGLGSGLLVFLVILIWQSALVPAAVIGGSIVLTLITSCLLGLTIPAILHFSKLDMKIAAGPLTLALADLFTIVIYFSIAALLL